MARRILFGLALFCTLSARPATAQTPVPSTTFSMTGTHATNDLVTVTYRAFQNPGDPYRVVCSEPCTADLNAIYGLYAGFAPVYQQIVALFGVAPTANVVPFDMHIDADHWCGPEQPGVGGISDYFWEVPWAGFTSGSYACFWFTVPGHYGIPFTSRDEPDRFPSADCARVHAHRVLPPASVLVRGLCEGGVVLHHHTRRRTAAHGSVRRLAQ